MFGNIGFNNNSNVKNSNNSTTTNIRTFFGDLSCFQISYWDDKLSLKIHPLATVNADGVRQYDYSRKIQTALVSDKCIALSKAIEKKILPAIEEGSEASIAISLGKSVIAINTKKEADTFNVYFTIYPLTQDGTIDKTNAYVYKFNKTNILLDFNNESGTGTEEHIQSEFLFLYKKLKNITNISGEAVHSINVDNTMKSNFKNNNSNSQNSNNNYSAPVSNFGMSDFPFS